MGDLQHLIILSAITGITRTPLCLLVVPEYTSPHEHRSPWNNFPAKKSLDKLSNIMQNLKGSSAKPVNETME
ncbi:MAG TPA: hypothetical protein ENJ08_09155 [Gammaproteobacteria bacterium]|nr:hypothetical protein [Gammaproteobacteria bacterium]